MKTLVVAGFFFCLIAAPTATADHAFDRTVNTAKASTIIPSDIIETARAACKTALCFAKALAEELPDHVRLEPVDHPDTDSIRWVKTTPSLGIEKTPDTLKFKLAHFGRKAISELREALTGAGGRLIELDVSGNPGGDFERMLAIAGLLLGSRRDVVEIDYGDHIKRRSLHGLTTRNWKIVSVKIDEKTASAALLLTRLFAVHAGAELMGPAADEDPIYLKHRIPIGHDLRLILPVAEVRVIVP